MFEFVAVSNVPFAEVCIVLHSLVKSVRCVDRAFDRNTQANAGIIDGELNGLIDFIK